MSHSPQRAGWRGPAAIRQQAKRLRQSETPAECLLWQHLRDRQLAGLKFRRQHPIAGFIADFYCAEQRLIVEIDGAVHDGQAESDAERSRLLELEGYRIIRFRNEEVLGNLAVVLQRITAVCR